MKKGQDIAGFYLDSEKGVELVSSSDSDDGCPVLSLEPRGDDGSYTDIELVDFPGWDLFACSVDRGTLCIALTRDATAPFLVPGEQEAVDLVVEELRARYNAPRGVSDWRYALEKIAGVVLSEDEEAALGQVVGYAALCLATAQELLLRKHRGEALDALVAQAQELNMGY